MNLDAKYLIRRLSPALEDFCDNCTYLYPDDDFMSGISITVVKDLPSEVPNRVRLGQYSKDRVISLNSAIKVEEMASTIVHELAHAIQHYNLGTSFLKVYSHQLKLVGYDDNIFEVQARQASELLSFFSTGFKEDLASAIRGMMREYAYQVERTRLKKAEQAKKARQEADRLLIYLKQQEKEARKSSEYMLTEKKHRRAIEKKYTFNTGRK